MEELGMPVPEFKSVTSNCDFSRSIAGIKLDRWMPFLYRSSGCRLRFTSAFMIQPSKRENAVLTSTLSHKRHRN
jgi:hypothetical protein